MMIVPIIPCFQIVGVFIASFMGISIIGRCISRNSVASSHMIFFGIGMAMATCGLFF
jgi:hypothetical protein